MFICCYYLIPNLFRLSETALKILQNVKKQNHSSLTSSYKWNAFLIQVSFIFLLPISLYVRQCAQKISFEENVINAQI